MTVIQLLQLLKWLLLAALAIFVLYFILLIIAALLVNPHKVYLKHSRFYRSLLNTSTAVALKLVRVRVHASGIEKVPQGEKLLFVSNHMSNFDPIVTWHVFRKHDIAYVSKPENFKIPIFGRIIRKCCFLPIDRKNCRKASETIKLASELLGSREVSMGIYPEGTRSKSGVLLPFHNGCFKVAQKGQASMAVMCLRGTEKIHKNYPWRASDVYLEVLDVIPAQELMSENTSAIGSRVEQLLREALGQ